MFFFFFIEMTFTSNTSTILDTSFRFACLYSGILSFYIIVVCVNITRLKHEGIHSFPICYFYKSKQSIAWMLSTSIYVHIYTYKSTFTYSSELRRNNMNWLRTFVNGEIICEKSESPTMKSNTDRLKQFQLINFQSFIHNYILITVGLIPFLIKFVPLSLH